MMSKEAMKLAKAWFERNTYGDEAVDVYEALCEALAEQPAQQEPESECNPQDLCAGCRCKYAEQPAQQEPVAWRWSESGGVRWFHWTTDWSHYDRAKAMGFPIEYAYTSPPAQRKPLTPREYNIALALVDIKPSLYEAVTRAIEAAHNIKENK